MGVMKQALEILWTRGKAHAMLKDGRYLKAAFGDCFDDLREELLVAIKNTRAGECTSIMMSEWCKMLGVKYDATLGVKLTDISTKIYPEGASIATALSSFRASLTDPLLEDQGLVM